MKPGFEIGLAGKLSAELVRCEEEGRRAAASAQTPDACPYRHPAKVVAWLRGFHLHGREEFRQPAGTVAVKRAIPQIASLRAALGHQADSGEPGWWRYGRGDVAHWFAKPGERAMCGDAIHDYAWVREDSLAWCVACWREIEFRRKRATLPPISDQRRAELQAQLKHLMR